MSLTAQTIRTILAAIAVSLVIVALTSKAATQEEPKKTGGSIVRGVVTYSDTGRPLRNATVGLLRDADGESAWEGTTDHHGEFVTDGVPAGRYVLLLKAPGILRPLGFRTRENPVMAQLRLYDKRDLFTEVIVNGTDSIDVKVPAIRGGVITGRVVTDDDQPLPNADIRLLRREHGEWVPVDLWKFFRHPKGLTTDPSGVYRIAGLPAGDYLVRASEEQVPLEENLPVDDAYSKGSMMMTYYPSAISVEEAQAVTVLEGSESTGVDIRLPPLTPYAISGRILGPDNEPGTKARIRIARKDELNFVYDEYDVYSYADADGNWRIPGVPAGEYVITIGDTIEVGPAENSRYRMVAPKQISVRVANGDVVVPDIKLSNGATISGKMIVDGKTPKLTYDSTPYLISTDDVAARRGSSLRKQATRFQINADPEDGSFYVSGLPAGKYWFEMSVGRTDKFYVRSVTRKGVDFMQSPLRLKDEAVVDDLVISIATDFASIEGEIAPDGKRKHSPRDVLVLLAPATDATRRISIEPRMVQADAQGKFGFNAPPGEYFVVALTPAEIKKLPPINDDYFKSDGKTFTRVKVRGAEKLKGLRISAAVN